MPAKKGYTNNPNGRPKGKPNRTTKEVKQTLINFINENLDDLQSEYDKLEPMQKFQFLEKILKFVVPTQNYTEADVNENILTDKDRKEVLERLKNEQLNVNTND
jgi:hypothetical protein